MRCVRLGAAFSTCMKDVFVHTALRQNEDITCTERSRSDELDVEAPPSLLNSSIVSRDVLMSVNMLSSLLVNW